MSLAHAIPRCVHTALAAITVLAMSMAAAPLTTHAAESSSTPTKGVQPVETLRPHTTQDSVSQPTLPKKGALPGKADDPARIMGPQTLVASFSASVVNRGQRVFLELARAPSKVEIHEPSRRVQTLPGKGARSFDITTQVIKARDARLRFRIFGDSGTFEEVTLDVGKARSIAQSRLEPTGKTTAGDDAAAKDTAPSRQTLKGSLLPGMEMKPAQQFGEPSVKRPTAMIPPGTRPLLPDKEPATGELLGRQLPSLMKPRPPEGTDEAETGPETGGFGSARLESRMSATAVLPTEDFPARIDSVTNPVAVGASMTLIGHDFGRRQGHVDVSVRGATGSCEITDWQDTIIRCVVPASLALAVGNRPMDATVWVRPAAVAAPDPSRVMLGGSRTYAYSGDEGPRAVTRLSPMRPVISALSSTSIAPLDVVEIDGRGFGNSRGDLRFEVSGTGYRTEILAWDDARIRFRLTDAEGLVDSYGYGDALYEGEPRAASIIVTNGAGNAAQTHATFVPGATHPRIRLHIAGVHVTRTTAPDGRRQFDIRVTVENRENGRTWRRIRVSLRAGANSYAVWIDDGIGPRGDRRFAHFRHVDDDWRSDIEFRVTANADRNVPETDDSVHECRATFLIGDRERSYSCMTM